MTSTIVSAWSDRALESQRLNLRQNRPEVEGSRRSHRRLLPTARRRLLRPIPDDVNRVRRICQGGGRGPRHTERAAILEPDRGWGRPRGHGPVVPERAGKTRLNRWAICKRTKAFDSKKRELPRAGAAYRERPNAEGSPARIPGAFAAIDKVCLMLEVGEIRNSISGFVLIGDMQQFGAGGQPMHRFELDGRRRQAAPARVHRRPADCLLRIASRCSPTVAGTTGLARASRQQSNRGIAASLRSPRASLLRARPNRSAEARPTPKAWSIWLADR